MSLLSNLPTKVALVHDWLIRMRGGEKVLEGVHQIFPDAPIYTLICDRKRLSALLKQADIRTSWLQGCPGVRSYYRWLLPILPWVIRQFDLSSYDLVISSSHCVAKGCRIEGGTLHVTYCHTPMRYAWEMGEEYFSDLPKAVKSVINFFMVYLRRWDQKVNETVHHFIANSENTRNRIRKYYHREASIIHPPVDTDFYKADGRLATGEFFLIVSALVPYKRVDIAVEAFNQLGYPLVVVGEGPCFRALRRKARPNVRLLGWQDDHRLKEYYRQCKALVFPGEEDFGIVPVECQATGKPVIAFGKGGVLESVTDETGVFFTDPTAAGLINAVREFESRDFKAELIRKRAERFDQKFFRQKMKDHIEELYAAWRKEKDRS